jgi:hypothetical protein
MMQYMPAIMMYEKPPLLGHVVEMALEPFWMLWSREKSNGN